VLACGFSKKQNATARAGRHAPRDDRHNGIWRAPSSRVHAASSAAAALSHTCRRRRVAPATTHGQHQRHADRRALFLRAGAREHSPTTQPARPGGTAQRFAAGRGHADHCHRHGGDSGLHVHCHRHGGVCVCSRRGV
jgi:hypothetical protein